MFNLPTPTAPVAPVEDFSAAILANQYGVELDDTEPVPVEKIDYKSKDLALYNAWAQDKSKKNLTKLVNHLGPLIHKEVTRAAGALPLSALNAEAKNWAIKAVETYDPSRGFALSTHVTGYLQRVRRMNAKYQHVARLPENKKWEFRDYNLAKTQLEDELNREPADHELAAKLGWSKGQVIKFKGRIYSDLVENEDEKAPAITSYSNENLLMTELLSRLSPEEKTILEHKGQIPASELAAKLGVNTNRLNYLQSKLVSKIQGLKTDLRM